MEETLQNFERILCRHIPGFHQYILGEKSYPVYISDHLANMLRIPAEELLQEGTDVYAQRVHPADQESYQAFLQDMGMYEQERRVDYRLICADGSILHISDTMTSYCVDGVMFADSVLTDITQLKNENQNLHFLSETMPCGFLKYTCEKTPKITYINDQMKQILRIPKTEDPALYMQNVYMMIPAQERRRFSVYLDRVFQRSAPIAGEMTVVRCDGTQAHLFGWVTKCVRADGTAEFQSACMDITERYQVKKEQETQRYLKALTDVYDTIFEYDRVRRSVKCLYSHNSPMFQWIENIPMQMEEATEQWIVANVEEADRDRLRGFFADFYNNNPGGSDAPPVIRYTARSSGGGRKRYSGIFLKMDSAVSLFCCRSIPDYEEADVLRSENASLKNMQELVMRYSDGLAAFEIIDNVVTPLYASDNVCEFFGYDRKQWMSVMKTRTPIRDFVARSRASYGDFMELLDKGEAEFTYYDLSAKRNRRIKAICSQKSPESSKARYVMLYKIDDQIQKPEEKCTVRIRTFGYFDVFVNEKPIAFRNEKSKELFALLVDRRGGFVTSEEAISYLWEDEPANPVTLARYRKVALRLKNLLEEYGISEIVESVNGKRRLVTEKVSCDLYDYLSGQEEYAGSFKGNYLTNYSWGEITLAELTGEHIY